LNLLFERVHPWHPIRLRDIAADEVNLHIGSVPVCILELGGDWYLHSACGKTESQNYVIRINAILDGAYRDDDGNLIKPKD